jgi:hypothetical protein
MTLLFHYRSREANDAPAFRIRPRRDTAAASLT